MKGQKQAKLVFSLYAIVFAVLLSVVVVAQSAQGSTWVSPSSGITVTVTTPMQPQNTVIYKFEGTGKNGAPKGTGKTDPLPVPTKCPRDPVTEALYSETHDIKDKDGKVIAKIKIVRNTDCTTHSMTITDDKGKNPRTLIKR